MVCPRIEGWLSSVRSCCTKLGALTEKGAHEPPKDYMVTVHNLSDQIPTETTRLTVLVSPLHVDITCQQPGSGCMHQAEVESSGSGSFSDEQQHNTDCTMLNCTTSSITFLVRAGGPRPESLARTCDDGHQQSPWSLDALAADTVHDEEVCTCLARCTALPAV